MRLRFWSKKKVNKEIKEAVYDTNKFVIIIIAIMLSMLPIIASVFGGVFLADFFSQFPRESQASFFAALVLIIAFLTFYDVRKKLHMKERRFK
jgi:Mn2+/Fe2+ NRAMP family transporter